ncbi:hypothetical protein PMAYCL1PPCAC_22412, partial [Pristionchus mayeri]
LQKSLGIILEIHRCGERNAPQAFFARVTTNKVIYNGFRVVTAADNPFNTRKTIVVKQKALTEAGDSSRPQLFHNDTPIKDEPLEVKEEPIEDLNEIKMEEPIADVFCPSTGNS